MSNQAIEIVPQTMTARQAATYLGVSLYVLNASRHKGHLLGRTPPKYLKIGRSIRYRVKTLDEWLDSCEEADNTSQYKEVLCD